MGNVGDTAVQVTFGFDEEHVAEAGAEFAEHEGEGTLVGDDAVVFVARTSAVVLVGAQMRGEQRGGDPYQEAGKDCFQSGLRWKRLRVRVRPRAVQSRA
jgi:hypothetical protein